MPAAAGTCGGTNFTYPEFGRKLNRPNCTNNEAAAAANMYYEFILPDELASPDKVRQEVCRS